MKVPPKRKGNSGLEALTLRLLFSLNESPSEKEGKCVRRTREFGVCVGLNESPSEKEGKSRR